MLVMSVRPCAFFIGSTGPIFTGKTQRMQHPPEKKGFNLGAFASAGFSCLPGGGCYTAIRFVSDRILAKFFCVGKREMSEMEFSTMGIRPLWISGRIPHSRGRANLYPSVLFAAGVGFAHRKSPAR